MNRFLLIICGDGTDYFSAPIDCDSVKNIASAIEKYKRCGLVNDSEAGIGLLALALRIRLSSAKEHRHIIDGRKHFEGVCLGREPMLTVRDLTFNVKIDASKIISDEEHALWVQEDSCDFCFENNDVYKVVILEDCV